MRKMLLWLPWLLLLAAPTQAKTLTPTELLNQVLESFRPVGQFELSLEATVYDPEAFIPLGREGDPGIPYEIRKHAFRQKVVFIRDEFYAVESRGRKNQLLHISLSQEGLFYSQAMRKTNPMSDEDAAYEPFLFYTQILSRFKRALGRVGIAPLEVDFAEAGGHMYYRLGYGDEFLLVELENFRVAEVHRQIQVGGRYYPTRIVFSNWDKRKKRIPRRIDYYIEGRLFKQLQVSKLNFSRIANSRYKLQKKYKLELEHLEPADLLIEPVDMKALIETHEEIIPQP